MSETRSQQEPSMEEILASIRRIISEDGQEPQSESKSESSERTEPRLAQPAQSEQKPAHEEAERPRLRAVGSGEAEILVLTEMVAEDGSVVSLAAQSPAVPAAQSPAAMDLSTTLESAGLPEPPDSPPNGLRGELPEELPGGERPPEEQSQEERPQEERPRVEQPQEERPREERPREEQPRSVPLGSSTDDPPAGSFGDPDLTQRKMPPALDERRPAQREAVQSEAAKPEAAKPEAVKPELGQKPAAKTVEPPKVETVMPLAETMPAFEADDRMESETMSNEARKKLELVSQEAEAASTAALAELARTVSRDRDKDTPLDGGRSVEDLVREALKPMLREWLDANLPDLVERVVRTEIQRMIRRAEDKA